MNEVLESAQHVMSQAQHVTIDRERLAAFADALVWNEPARWPDASPVPFLTGDADADLDQMLLLSSLSFCFWGEPKWTVTYRGVPYDGWWGMVAAFRRAREEGIALDPAACAAMTRERLAHILRGSCEIPLFAERLRIVQETGSVLQERFGGSARALVEEAGGDAWRLVELVAATFPSFRDVASYSGAPVHFYKRAQLFAADAHWLLSRERLPPARKLPGAYAPEGCSGEGWRGRGLARMEALTAFPDYKLPQMLRKFGILAYREGLANRVDRKEPIPAGSPEEVEIRAATVWAVELLRQRLRERFPDVQGFTLGDYFWILSQQKEPGDKPYHQTRTIFY